MKLNTLDQKILLLNHLPLPEDMIGEIKQCAFHNAETYIRRKMLEIMKKSAGYNGENCKICGNYIVVSRRTYAGMLEDFQKRGGRIDKSWRFNGRFCVCVHDDDYNDVYNDVEDVNDTDL